MAGLAIDFNKLKNIKLTKEQQQYVVLGVLLLAGGVYGYANVVIKPMSVEAAKLQKEYTDKQASLDKARRLKGQWEEYNQRLARTQAGLAFVGRRLPTESTYDLGFAKLVRMATEGSVELRAALVNNDPAQNKSEYEGYDKKVMTVDFSGDFHGLGEFLSRLTGEDVVYLFEDLRLLGAAANYQNQFHESATLEFKLVTYVEKPTAKK